MTYQTARRFYKEVTTILIEGAFQVALDGRSVRTPSGAVLSLPTAALAEAIALEWAAQTDTIDPATMPIMQLACTALDRVTPNRKGIVADTVAYGRSDLLCYRAGDPPELVQKQAEAWQPILNWLSTDVDATLLVTTGIMHVAQDDAAIAALNQTVAAFEDFPLTAVAQMTQVFGSLALALAVARVHIPWTKAVDLAALDEVYQAERWGEDSEAMERRRNMRAEAEQASRFLELCKA